MTLKMALIRKIKRLIGIQSPSEHMWGFKPKGLKDDFKRGYQKRISISSKKRWSASEPRFETVNQDHTETI